MSIPSGGYYIGLDLSANFAPRNSTACLPLPSPLFIPSFPFFLFPSSLFFTLACTLGNYPNLVPEKSPFFLFFPPLSPPFPQTLVYDSARLSGTSAPHVASPVCPFPLSLFFPRCFSLTPELDRVGRGYRLFSPCGQKNKKNAEKDGSSRFVARGMFPNRSGRQGGSAVAENGRRGELTTLSAFIYFLRARFVRMNDCVSSVPRPPFSFSLRCARHQCYYFFS